MTMPSQPPIFLLSLTAYLYGCPIKAMIAVALRHRFIPLWRPGSSLPGRSASPKSRGPPWRLTLHHGSQFPALHERDWLLLASSFTNHFHSSPPSIMQPNLGRYDPPAEPPNDPLQGQATPSFYRRAFASSRFFRPPHELRKSPHPLNHIDPLLLYTPIAWLFRHLKECQSSSRGVFSGPKFLSSNLCSIPYPLRSFK